MAQSDVESSQELTRDLQATVQARRELGPDYDDALAQSFVDKVDHEIARRVETAVTADREAASHDGYPVTLAYASLALGIPISGAAGGTAGVAGLAIAWAGIAAINIAAAIGGRRRRA